VFEFFKRLALRLAKVPPEPHAPAGSPGSIRIFQAAPNYWKYLLVMWGLRHITGAIAIFFLLSMTATWESASRTAAADTAAPTKPNRPPLDAVWGGRLAGAIHSLELLGLGFFLLQMPVSLAAARLNYEMRWYIVTDRSLRVREGIFKVREMTLTYANVQNISIRQGPLQRLLGLADVVVRTAGGGGAADAHGHESEGGGSMHAGTLRAVNNADQVRDFILERLRRLRDSGLGDPDDRQRPVFSGAEALRAAAHELLAEARALRK